MLLVLTTVIELRDGPELKTPDIELGAVMGIAKTELPSALREVYGKETIRSIQSSCIVMPDGGML